MLILFFLNFLVIRKTNNSDDAECNITALKAGTQLSL